MSTSYWAERLAVIYEAIKRVQATDLSKVPLRDFERVCKATDDRFRDLIVEYEATYRLHRLSQGYDDAAAWERLTLERRLGLVDEAQTRSVTTSH